MMNEVREIKSGDCKVVIEMSASQYNREIVLDGQPTNTFENVQYNTTVIRFIYQGKEISTALNLNVIDNVIHIGINQVKTPELVAQIIAAYEEIKEMQNEEIASWTKVVTQEEIEDIKEAQIVIAEVERVGEENLLTDKEESVWIKQYNDIHNEGEQGYIPQRATKESYARAIKILERA